MHISEGVLPASLLISSGVVAAIGVAVGLKKIKPHQMMGVALFSALFFVASLIHIRLGATSVHLVLTGLLGVSLGIAAFPAIFIALILQGVLFQMGGITTLGVNTCIMALPAVAAYYIFHPYLASGKVASRIIIFFCGALPVLLSTILAAAYLYFAGEAFFTPAITLFVAHIPIAIVEGILTVFIIVFLQKVRPELLVDSTLHNSPPHSLHG